MTSNSNKQKPVTLESIREAMRQVEALVEQQNKLEAELDKGVKMFVEWASNPNRVLCWAGSELATAETKAIMADLETRYPESYQARVRVNTHMLPDAIFSIDCSYQVGIFALGKVDPHNHPAYPVFGLRKTTVNT